MSDKETGRRLFEVLLPMEPRGKGRPRVDRRGVARTPARTRNWEMQAAILMRNARKGKEPLDEPVVLDVLAVQKVPKGRKKSQSRQWWPTKVPADGDNILKIVADALVKADILSDDGRIVEWRVRKLWGFSGESSHLQIVLRQPDPLPEDLIGPTS